MSGFPAADLSDTVSAPLIQQATHVLGAKPVFMGRYFKNPQNPEAVQYHGRVENPILRAAGIPVLCLARQTPRVGGTKEDGIADAVWNMAAIIEAFGLAYLHGLGYDPLVFLDVEPATPMSATYYAGWADALRNHGEFVPRPLPSFTVRFTPAIYINKSDGPSWTALGQAMQQGAQCFGAWVAHYISQSSPPAWDPGQVNPPPPIDAPCPVIGWQYFENYMGGNLDFSILEPNAAAATLELMIPVPAQAVEQQIA
jgi:hypothetical protein